MRIYGFVSSVALFEIMVLRISSLMFKSNPKIVRFVFLCLIQTRQVSGLVKTPPSGERGLRFGLNPLETQSRNLAGFGFRVSAALP